MKNILNPKWEPATIDVNVLCDGNLDRRIKISIFDHESDGKHEKMGSIETSVKELTKAAFSGETFTSMKGSKSYGEIAVDECKVTGVDTSTSATTTAQPDAYAYAPTASAPVPMLQMGAMSLGGCIPVPVPPPRTPTFVDYVSGNCDLSMVRNINFNNCIPVFSSASPALY